MTWPPHGSQKVSVQIYLYHTGVSLNGGTPKSSILIGFSIISHPFWGTPILGNPHRSPFSSGIFQAGKVFKPCCLGLPNAGPQIQPNISIAASGSLNRWDRWYIITQLAAYTTYIPLIVLANWVIICITYHLLREPGNSIDIYISVVKHSMVKGYIQSIKVISDHVISSLNFVFSYKP